MRIISGRYKGHKLCSFSKNLPLRPMTQIVKKSIFDTIRSSFEKNPNVLDLFSGTGNLSFESLSRGAISSCAVENNKSCCKMIRRNAEKLGIKRALTLYSKDVFQFLKTYNNPRPFDIIFVDPPFSQWWSHRIIKNLSASSVCDEHSLIVLETSLKEPFNDEIISLNQKKKFGDKIVYFFHIKNKIIKRNGG